MAKDQAQIKSNKTTETADAAGEAAGTEAVVDEKAEGAASKKKENAEAAKARKAADSVTDFHIEKEIDLKKAVAAVAALGNSEIAKKDSNLFDGEIKAADVTALVEECDMSKEQAEKFLRQNQGVLATALKSYLAQ